MFFLVVSLKSLFPLREEEEQIRHFPRLASHCLSSVPGAKIQGHILRISLFLLGCFHSLIVVLFSSLLFAPLFFRSASFFRLSLSILSQIPPPLCKTKTCPQRFSQRRPVVSALQRKRQEAEHARGPATGDAVRRRRGLRKDCAQTQVHRGQHQERIGCSHGLQDSAVKQNHHVAGHHAAEQEQPAADVLEEAVVHPRSIIKELRERGQEVCNRVAAAHQPASAAGSAGSAAAADDNVIQETLPENLPETIVGRFISGPIHSATSSVISCAHRSSSKILHPPLFDHLHQFSIHLQIHQSININQHLHHRQPQDKCYSLSRHRDLVVNPLWGAFSSSSAAAAAATGSCDGFCIAAVATCPVLAFLFEP
jgi:hypothetical protein